MIRSIDLGDNEIADTDDALYESLAHLPLKYPSLTVINLGQNEIKAGLVESLCNVNNSQAAHPLHGFCEKVSLMYVHIHVFMCSLRTFTMAAHSQDQRQPGVS
jgi:hypothetical protein